MPSEQPESNWPIGLRIRPSADPESPLAEVTDVISGRRFSWSPESLSEYILAGGQDRGELTGDRDGLLDVLDLKKETGDLLPGWLHWQERGWQPSDQYYIASRRWDYVDTADPDGSIRSAAVRRFLSIDGPPPEEDLPDGPRVALGEPADPGSQQVSSLMVSRRSGRAYVLGPVPLEKLSGLLWHGLSRVRLRRERTSKDNPMSYLDSYGAAWDFQLCVYDVAGVEPGTYRYDLRSHELIGIRPGDHRTAMMDVLQGMHSPATAAWTLGLVADFPRIQWRYRHEHGLRRLYLESGILAQEFILLGMAYGLSTLVTPAQKDSPYLALHDLSPERFAPIYTFTMGTSRGGSSVGIHGESITQVDPDAS